METISWWWRPHRLKSRPRRGEVGSSHVVWCPLGCAAVGSVQGTDAYAFDSSICRAAIHASLLTDASGGAVKVLVEPAHPPYCGSLRNGVRSESAVTSMGGFLLRAR